MALKAQCVAQEVNCTAGYIIRHHMCSSQEVPYLFYATDRYYSDRTGVTPFSVTPL